MKYTDRILHQSILAVTTQATYERIIQVAATRMLYDASEQLSRMARDFGSMTTADRVSELAFIKSNLSALTSLNFQSASCLEVENED